MDWNEVLAVLLGLVLQRGVLEFLGLKNLNCICYDLAGLRQLQLDVIENNAERSLVGQA
jgi:hypothetical protein